MKLGKKPFIEDKRDLLFKNYTDATVLPTRPKTFGHYNLVSDWGVLGNDSVGDCTCAGADHETMLWTLEGGNPAAFTPQNTIADYSAITGYIPSDPNTDQGAFVRDVLLYRQKTGMIDTNSKRHKIGAFLALDQKDMNEVLEATYLFNAVGIGILFPQSAMEQFYANQPWTVIKGSRIEGGHYVPIFGYDPGYIYCVTWGKIQKMDYNFFKTYCDEAWAILSQEFLNGQGLSPEGFNLEQLQADLNAITDSPIPEPMLVVPKHDKSKVHKKVKHLKRKK